MTTTDPNSFTSQLYELLCATANGTDNAALRRATSTLNKKFYNSARCVPALLQIACHADEIGVRQLAAVEARKRCEVFWSECPMDIVHQGHAMLLSRLPEEPERVVATALARIIASIAVQDVSTNRWPNLVPTLLRAGSSQVIPHREIAATTLLYLLQVVTPEDIATYHSDVLNLLTLHLSDSNSRAIRITAMESLSELAAYVTAKDKSQVRFFQDQLPTMVAVVDDAMRAGDEDATARGLAVFDELVSGEAPVLNCHMAPFVEFVCRSFANRDYTPQVRIMAGNLLILLPLYKSKSIIKLKLVHPILHAVLPIAAEPEDANEDEDEDSPARIAIKCIHAFGMNFPPAQVFPLLSTTVALYAGDSASPEKRRASMMILALVVDGCADAARTHLEQLVSIVITLMGDSDPMVRKAACICMSALGESLEVGPSHHAQILPVLFNLMQDKSHIEVLRHATNALDTVLDGLGGTILPYINGLMNVLIQLLVIPETGVRQVVVGAIGSAANASSEQFRPYLIRVVPMILELMAVKDPYDHDVMLLRGIAIDTMSAMAEAVGCETFREYLPETTRLTREAMHIPQEPKLKECAYCFFGVLARMYKSEFTTMLNDLVPMLLESVTATESHNVNEDEGEEALDLNVEGSDTNTDVDTSLMLSDDSDDESDLFKVSSAIAEEKATAIDVLADLFESTESAFLPFLDATLASFLENADHYHDSVRKAVALGLFKILSTMHRMTNPAPWVPGLPVAVPVHEDVEKMTTVVMNIIIKMLDEEDERVVVAEICDALHTNMRIMGPIIVKGSGHLESVANVMVVILEGKHMSQLQDDDDEIEMDADELAEYDAILIASAADVIASLAHVLGGNTFAPFAQRFFTYLAKYFTPAAQVSERSMAVGTFVDVVSGIKSSVTQWHPGMMDIFKRAVNDPEAEVRSNGTYGVGLLAEYSDMSYTPRELIDLVSSSAISTELPNERDNATGALARILLRNDHWTSHSDILPTLLANLPMLADFEENKPVLKLLAHILRIGASGSVPSANEIINGLSLPLVTAIAQYFNPVNEVQTELSGRTDIASALREATAAPNISSHLQAAIHGLPLEQQQGLLNALSS